MNTVAARPTIVRGAATRDALLDAAEASLPIMAFFPVASDDRGGSGRARRAPQLSFREQGDAVRGGGRASGRAPFSSVARRPRSGPPQFGRRGRRCACLPGGKPFGRPSICREICNGATTFVSSRASRPLRMAATGTSAILERWIAIFGARSAKRCPSMNRKTWTPGSGIDSRR